MYVYINLIIISINLSDGKAYVLLDKTKEQNFLIEQYDGGETFNDILRRLWTNVCELDYGWVQPKICNTSIFQHEELVDIDWTEGKDDITLHYCCVIPLDSKIKNGQWVDLSELQNITNVPTDILNDYNKVIHSCFIQLNTEVNI